MVASIRTTRRSSCLQLLRRRVIHILSTASQFGAPGLTAYAATKAVVLGLKWVMAVEWRPHGVTVYTICLGNIDTELLRGVFAHRAAGRGVPPDEVIGNIVAKTPADRLGKPADVAATILFLASPEAAFVTGQVINVWGGSATTS